MPLFSADFFTIKIFKKFFQEHYQCQMVLHPDQNLCPVDPDLGPNCLERLDDKNQRNELGCCFQLLTDKYIFLISQPKHMLWVLKRTISKRQCTQKNCLKEMVLLST